MDPLLTVVCVVAGAIVGYSLGKEEERDINKIDKAFDSLERKLKQLDPPNPQYDRIYTDMTKRKRNAPASERSGEGE